MGRNLKPLKDRESNQFHFRVPLNDPTCYGVMEKAFIIIKREALSFDRFCYTAVEEYVARHFDGNYQTILHSYSDEGKLNQATIEGRIREQFRAQNINIRYRDIVYRCKQDVSDVKVAAPMAERVAQYLHEKGIKVWR
ncbi:hypothetical protein ES703_57869 [subsurface metagenome]